MHPALTLGDQAGVPVGRRLRPVRAIPLGGPMVLDRGGFRFAIRRVDAATIHVNEVRA